MKNWDSQSDWTPDETPALWVGKMIQDNNHRHGDGMQQPHQQHNSSEISSPEEHSKPGSGGFFTSIGAAIGLNDSGSHAEKPKQQPWVIGKWLQEAQDRTTQYRRHGLSSPACWILNQGTNIPPNAILSGEDTEKGWKMYPCRAFHDGGLQVGKASNVFKKGAVIGYKREEIHLHTYEILVGDMDGLRWVNVSGKINLANLGARPVEGGRENDGTLLYVTQAAHRGATHPGKTSEKLDGAYVPYNNSEVKISEYRVLCYA